MSRERTLEHRLRTLSTLEQAIGALRSLSARHFRAARAPLASARAYRDEVGAFLATLDPVAARGSPADHCGIVLVTADLGLVGDYSARLAREALDLRAERGPGPLLCVGHRAVSLLARSDVVPTSVRVGPGSVAGLPTLLLGLVDELLRLRHSGQLDSLWLVAARFEGAGQFSPMRVPVLPIQPPAGRPPLPISPYCAPAHVRAVVVREYLYAALYETLLESLASEHGKRLVVAESARSWLGDRIAATRRLAAAIRRETSTREVLEIAAGARSARRRMRRLR
jgi:F-type H+-transporting ATPase subunit gamma